MNIWKRGVCLLLTLVMAVALAGCGTRREPADAAGMPAGAAGDAWTRLWVTTGLRAYRGEPSV